MFSWLRRNSKHREEELRQVSEGLADYPLYVPPTWDVHSTALREANAEYKRFFFENRDRRLEALRVFLARFNVALNLDDAGVMALSNWLPNHADLLVDGLSTDSVRDAYDGLATPWTSSLLGLNAIFDLGIYFGECMLSRNSRLKWQPIRGPEPHNVGHPIFGQKNRRPFDPIKWIYVMCSNIYTERNVPVARDTEIATKEDSLYRHILAHASY